MSNTTVSIKPDNVTAVKLAIAGTPYTLGEFYAEAATEKIERDNLRKWIETPKTLNNGKRDKI